MMPVLPGTWGEARPRPPSGAETWPRRSRRRESADQRVTNIEPAGRVAFGFAAHLGHVVLCAGGPFERLLNLAHRQPADLGIAGAAQRSVTLAVYEGDVPVVEVDEIGR